MRNADAILSIIQERGKRNLKLDGIYRQLYNPELYLRAYGRLYRNSGAMTKGATEETVDSMSLRKIQGIIDLLRNERYRWTPVRRILIPKGNGKMRPLGIPTWSDKLLQEVMRSILEAYYEPQFSDFSHGFRPKRGCHTALEYAYFNWSGTKWFIEGDIKGCFDNIDHAILLSILRESIQDNRFLRLIEYLLKAGYLEQWRYNPTHSGTPQGGIISPLLANIYLDRLDRFVEKILIPGNTKGDKRKVDPEYNRVKSMLHYHRKKGSSDDIIRDLERRQKALPRSDYRDPDYRRLKYIRYADDFLLAFIGPKKEAEAIKAQLGEFLRDNLKLELSPEKTLITHAHDEKAGFLGYDLCVGESYGLIQLRIPVQKLQRMVARYRRNGKTVPRNELLSSSDFAIVANYGAVFRGIAQYYAYAGNRSWLHLLRGVMRHSLLMTLARKHKTTVAAMAKRFAGKAINGKGTVACLQVLIPRKNRTPLLAQFGGISLTTKRFDAVTIQDTIDTPHRYSRTELVDRLLAEECERCGSNENLEVHHIKKLADLRVRGQRERPDWMIQMAAMRRKTLVVCRECHDAIHAGKPTRRRNHVE